MNSPNGKSKLLKTQLEYLEKIKKLVIIAMFSDDELMNKLVLKGGNALDIIYKISARASIDVDFSLEDEFKESELGIIEGKIRKVLEETFLEEGLKVFDIKFLKKPSKVSAELKDFWGGYRVEFKVIAKDIFEKKNDDLEFLRRNASVTGPDQMRVFEIDISKFEFCKDKKQEELEGHTIYVYSPEMLVIEKLRAICQQMPEYKEIIKTLTISPRPRDFLDIYILMDKYSINLNERKNTVLLNAIFQAKKVPLSFLQNIEKFRDFHAQGFVSLRDTIKAKIEIKDFDFYFDFVIGKVKDLRV